jgi:hypothetical protein
MSKVLGIKVRVYKMDILGLNSIELLSTKYKCVEELDDVLKAFPIKGESEIVDLAEVLGHAINKVALLNRVKANKLEIDDRCAIERTYGCSVEYIVPSSRYECYTRVEELDEEYVEELDEEYVEEKGMLIENV